MAGHPELFPRLKTRRGRGGKRGDLNDRYFRSSWEANWARYLNFLIVQGDVEKWEYEVDVFEFPVKKGSKFYVPDFKVTFPSGRVVYHEIKGYMDQRSRTKLKRMKKYYPEVELELIDKDRYYAVATTMKHILSGWETR